MLNFDCFYLNFLRTINVYPKPAPVAILTRMLGLRPTLILRAAAPGDARALARLQESIYKEEAWFVGDGAPNAETLALRLRHRPMSHSLYLVALTQGELCGWLELNRLSAKRLSHIALLTLAVAKAHRRSGVASQLLSEGYVWAKRFNIKKITLNVRANNHGAVRLYEREGFEHEGLERNHIRTADGFEDNLIMAKYF